jgi:hypothetical protein
MIYQRCIEQKRTGSIEFCILPVQRLILGLSLDKMSIKEVDICDYLSWSSLCPSVVCLYLDPQEYDKPPLNGEPLQTNLHWMQLKDTLDVAAHTSGLPVIVQWWQRQP